MMGTKFPVSQIPETSILGKKLNNFRDQPEKVKGETYSEGFSGFPSNVRLRLFMQ